MTVRAGIVIGLLVGSVVPVSAVAQTSSLGAKKRQSETGRVMPKAAREKPRQERNRTYERYAWTSETPVLPKTFKPGDLLTVIVREQRKFEADTEFETKKDFNIKSELEAFIDLTRGGVGAAAFQRGKPTIDYKYRRKSKNEGDATREDRLTTRLTGKIIDVKPNGLLVFEARARIEHDEEVSTITLTGSCRKEDVTADNTILSTQVADKHVVVRNEGALRAVSTRGWIPRLLDLIKPF